MRRQARNLRAGSPVVEWFGVNERRVDAVVSAAGDQYRIVYFTDDGRTIDDLSLFRRPPPFDGVDGGRIVVVNGPSGAGKSSVLAALAASTELPWVVFDEPVMGSVDQPYLIWRDRAPQLHRGFLDAIAALAARRGDLVGRRRPGIPPPRSMPRSTASRWCGWAWTATWRPCCSRRPRPGGTLGRPRRGVAPGARRLVLRRPLRHDALIGGDHRRRRAAPGRSHHLSCRVFISPTAW